MIVSRAGSISCILGKAIVGVLAAGVRTVLEEDGRVSLNSCKPYLDPCVASCCLGTGIGPRISVGRIYSTIVSSL